MEEWRDIEGYEGLYQVSNLGRVRSLSHYTSNNVNGGKRYSEGRILSSYKTPTGYLQVTLSKNEKREKRYVHRLVAISFLDNKDHLSDVNHIDGDKNNNSIDNLEWLTHKDNQIHMVNNGMTRRAKPVECINTMKRYRSMMEAEKMTGIDRHFIKTSCDQGKEYKGCRWRYV